MNYLDKLLDGSEVEWKHLGTICQIKTGVGVTKKDGSDTGQMSNNKWWKRTNGVY